MSCVSEACEDFMPKFKGLFAFIFSGNVEGWGEVKTRQLFASNAGNWASSIETEKRRAKRFFTTFFLCWKASNGVHVHLWKSKKAMLYRSNWTRCGFLFWPTFVQVRVVFVSCVQNWMTDSGFWSRYKGETYKQCDHNLTSLITIDPKNLFLPNRHKNTPGDYWHWCVLSKGVSFWRIKWIWRIKNFCLENRIGL